MPNRIVREGFLDSEAIDRIGEKAECWYHRLILVVDDAGRYDGRPKMIASRAYPLRDSIRGSDVEKILATLEEAGLIARYEVGAKPYLQFSRWQRCGNAIKSKWPDRQGSYAIQYETVETRDGAKEFVTSSLWGADGVPMGSGSNSIVSNTETESIFGDGDEDGEGTSALGEPKTDPPPPNPRKRADATPYDRIFALYSEHCPSLAQMRLRTPKRDAGARRLWGKALSWAKSKGGGEAEAWGFVSVLFDAAQASPFLRGEKPSKDHPNWKADFEFVTRDESMAKIMEGAYDQ